MLISDLESFLFRCFPKSDAESWDHVGLSVGDPQAEVTGVVCALDVSTEAIEWASAHGCNVLLTHHPIYLDAPTCFSPAKDRFGSASAAVYRAALLGVGVLSFHTNLDRSHDARKCVSKAIELAAVSSLDHFDDPALTGYGAVFELAEKKTLSQLVDTCSRVFDTQPRVWGEPDRICSQMVFVGGSAGSFCNDALDLGADVLVCGEMGYHAALDASARGLSIVLLGHDRSEELFTSILVNRARQFLGSDVPVFTYLCPNQWWTARKEF